MTVQISNVPLAAGDTCLRGRLFLPTANGGGGAPAMILVHGLGSGGDTMDGCALELASRGVAALWFDQRGHGPGEGAYDGDSSEDVLAAAALLRAQAGIDAQRVGVVGHSSGARDAIAACVKDRRLAPLVCTSTPSDLPAPDGEGSSFVKRTQVGERPGGHVSRYPADGPLPWLEGRPLRALSWVMGWLRGYRLRVDWRRTFDAWSRARPSIMIEAMAPRPTLFVHSRNDRTAPVEGAEILFMKAQGPKELFVRPGGFHSTPVKKGALRRAWVEWTAEQAAAQREAAR